MAIAHAGSGEAISRQAVVIIHGIGEQRPMQTLRSFVRGALGMREGEDQFYSKPDHITDTLELRRLAVSDSILSIPTDFYELYWAHLMDGTTWRHVTAWFQMLLVRSPHEVPGRLKPLWWLAWISLALAAVWFVYARPDLNTVIGTGALAAVALALVRSFAGSFGLRVVGDAARYLSPTPANIRVRHAIRSAALSLLRGLHADARYDRIIVVGHSLGSVIAYDALTYLWQETHSVHGKPADPQQPLSEAMRSRVATLWRKHPASAPQPRATPVTPCPKIDDKELSEFRNLQRALWDEQRTIGIRWRVTDLVTLGSPLAYGPFLLAVNERDFWDRKRQRELPTCPPQLEDERDIGFLSKNYWTPFGDRKVQILHHAALFACTRWTNVYFPGDLIGGEIAPLFGPGVEDLRAAPKSFWGRWPTAHTRYWHERESLARAALRKALDLSDVRTTQQQQLYPPP